MARALFIIAIGVLLGGLIVWVVLSQSPPERDQSIFNGIRPPQTTQPPAR